MSEAHGIDPVSFGRAIAEVERGAEDRRNLTKALERLTDGQEGLRRDLMALSQTTNSTAHGLAELLKEKLSVRVAKLESEVYSDASASHTERLIAIEMQVQSWQRWIGSTKSFIFKVAAIIGGSTVAQAFFIKWLLGK